MQGSESHLHDKIQGEIDKIQNSNIVQTNMQGFENHLNYKTQGVIDKVQNTNDDDDEVRLVCKTCGCARQYYQRSGLPLPSPWIEY